MLLLGIAAGFVWLWLAKPAEWEVRSNGIVLDEAASRGQFSVIVVFVIIGAVASLVWGMVVAWVMHDLGWPSTPLVVMGAVVASVIAWRIGVELGPPDPRSVTGAALGDTIPSRLGIDTIAPLLVWPLFGLIGLIGTTLIGVGRTEMRQQY